jgi:hypothetical protein
MSKSTTTNPPPVKPVSFRTNRVVSPDCMTQADWYRYVELNGRTPGDTMSSIGESLGRHGDLT